MSIRLDGVCNLVRHVLVALVSNRNIWEQAPNLFPHRLNLLRAIRDKRMCLPLTYTARGHKLNCFKAKFVGGRQQSFLAHQSF